MPAALYSRPQGSDGIAYPRAAITLRLAAIKLSYFVGYPGTELEQHVLVLPCPCFKRRLPAYNGPYAEP